ncbi:MAG TPA: hypothetical protein VII09_08560, partial [Opitutaceae bacterium]
MTVISSQPSRRGFRCREGRLSLITGAAWVICFLSAPALFASPAQSERLTRCGRDEAEFTYNFTYSFPGEGAGAHGDGGYARRFKAGDEKNRPWGPSGGSDMMGVVTTTWIEFSEKEVTFRLREVPGPDLGKPYEVIIHAPFQQNVSGTVEETKYELTWKAVAPGEDLLPHLDFSKSFHGPVPHGPVGPVINSVTLSPH